MVEHLQVFITLPDKKGAERLSQKLLEKRLAACIQVIGPITSHYWWQEKITHSKEWLCIAKTTRHCYHELEKTVQEFHSYEVPEIIALPITAGYQPYFKWLQQELKPTRTRKRK